MLIHLPLNILQRPKLILKALKFRHQASHLIRPNPPRIHIPNIHPEHQGLTVACHLTEDINVRVPLIDALYLDNTGV